ncbi:ESCO family N-acetyltransferase [Roseobacter sp. TSBP12]|uniref:ESCO family N-acetyltransferase n=1 Tax=Roseobacter sp. TSBP12 TaxID=1236613 RepID=UPI001869F4C0|nr:ESCO family N-acetyltransferase [Roseobacter sp. TSBP12]
MTFVNYIFLPARELAILVNALKRPGSGNPSSRGRALIEAISQQGWAKLHQLEDLISMQDSRVDWTALRDVEGIARQLNINLPFVGFKPQTKDHDFSGGVGLSTAGAACLLIWLERLGFQVNATAVCAEVARQTEEHSCVSDEEVTALWYIDQRHTMGPVTVGTEPCVIPIGEVDTFKTSSGYRVEVTNGADGAPAIMSVTAPHCVEGPAREAVTCPVCGMLYLSGYKPDEHEHRIFHRKTVTTLRPVPSRAIKTALKVDPEAVWVNERSPSWLRIAVHRRAKAFKREMGFDFTQWDPTSDEEAIGFLFVDDDHRIVGTCCFRPTDAEAGGQMKLDWIWIAPDERRKGWLTKNWQRFVGRFGEFDVERPISDEMQRFLVKNGLDHLL